MGNFGFVSQKTSQALRGLAFVAFSQATRAFASCRRPHITHLTIIVMRCPELFFAFRLPPLRIVGQPLRLPSCSATVAAVGACPESDRRDRRPSPLLNLNTATNRHELVIPRLPRKPSGLVEVSLSHDTPTMAKNAKPLSHSLPAKSSMSRSRRNWHDAQVL